MFLSSKEAILLSPWMLAQSNCHVKVPTMPKEFFNKFPNRVETSTDFATRVPDIHYLGTCYSESRL